MEEEIYLLEFKTIEDLTISFEKIKKAWHEQGIVHKEKLRKKDIQFEEIGNYGISIDIDLIPEEIQSAQEVLNWFRDKPIIDACHKELNIKLLNPLKLKNLDCIGKI